MIAEDLIHQRFNRAKGLNFAACRFPDDNQVYFFYSSAKPVLKRLSYEVNQPYDFVCSPYGAGNQAYFLQAEAVYANDQLIAGAEPAVDVNLPEPEYAVPFVADRLFYEQYVNTIIQHIKADKLDKVVAARCEDVQLPEGFQHSHYFISLLKEYPHGMVYYIHSRETGCWIGASPEQLVRVGDGKLKTVALAGTRPSDTTGEWGEKETIEQHMVADFIEQLLEQYKLPFRKSPLFTLQTGHISHLCNTFEAGIDEEWLSKKFHKFLSELNPTPAVCGIPQFDASYFIAKHERTERRFYSGFIGMVQPSAIHLHVNLRCMELGHQRALLYAGAGITADSEASKEWDETGRKMDALRALM